MSVSSIVALPAKAYQFAHSLIVRDGAPTASTGLQPSVIAAVPVVFGPWEGQALPFMYTDSKGHVTVGTGNEIDSPGAAIASGTWHHGTNGPIASADEVAAGWQTVKSAWPGVQSVNSASLTDLRLDKASLDAKMDSTIASFWATLLRYFPNAGSAPADAQMALLSNAWPWGAAFVDSWNRYFNGLGSQFQDAFNRGDYATASKLMQQGNAHEITINPGIAPRVAGQVVMLANAAKNRSRPATLYYPGTVSGAGAIFGHLPTVKGAATTAGLAAAGALAGGPLGLAAGLAAGILAPHVASAASTAASNVRRNASSVVSRVRSRL